MANANKLKKDILDLTRDYSKLIHSAFRPEGDTLRTEWQEGSVIPYAGRVFTEEEVTAAVSTTLDFWLTLGSEGVQMEKELSEFLGIRKCLLVNSGSSANLVAISALTSYKLKEKQIKVIQTWMEEKIEETYININKDSRKCVFVNNWLKL